jgi:hypothetical protein
MAAGLNRGWFVERDQATDFGEGTEASQRKAAVLGEIADAEFIDTIIKIKTFLDSFGGQVWIGAQRLRFDRSGQRVSHNQPGQYTTTAYITKFTKDPVKGEPEEPEVTFKDVADIYLSQLAPEQNGNGSEPVEEPDPEAVATGD